MSKEPEPHPRIPWLIMQMFHYTRRAFDEGVRVHGVSASQLAVLNRVADHPGLSGAELARQMYTTPQAAQLMLATLVRKGLVDRTPHPGHGRIVCSVLTAEGRRIVDACRSEVEDVYQQLIGVLDPHERDTLIELMERFMRQGPRDSA